jgi:hypothetical protein
MPRTIRFHLDENCSKAIADVRLGGIPQAFHGRIVHDRRRGLCGRRQQCDDRHDAHDIRDRTPRADKPHDRYLMSD